MSWGDNGAFATAPQVFLVPNFLTDFSSRYVHILGADTNSYSRLDVKRGGKASSCGVRIDTIANIQKLKIKTLSIAGWNSPPLSSVS